MKIEYLAIGGIALFFLMKQGGGIGGGGHEPPNERWYDVPGIGITPEGMLGTVGYVYMPELQGYVKRADLIANGWVLTNGVWDLPHSANAGDYLAIAGSVLGAVGGAFGNNN